MAHFWKRHLALAALVSAPLLATASVAVAQVPPPGPPPGADTQKATALFVKGTELFKAKQYRPALEAFEQSYRIVPSPNSHLYIARCKRDLGDARGAYLEFDKVIREATERGEKYTPTRDEARTERDELNGKIGFVVLSIQGGGPGTVVRINGRDVPPDQWSRPFPVEPGMVDVVVQAPGAAPSHQTVNVDRGQQAPLAVNLNAPVQRIDGPPPTVVHRGPSPMRIGAFVAGGVGVVGFAMFAGAGAASSSTFSSLETMCGGVKGCPNPIGGRQAADDKINSGKTQQAIANAGLGIGIVGIAAGATLFVLSMRGPKGDDRRPTASNDGGFAPKPPLKADLVVGPSWAGVKGSF